MTKLKYRIEKDNKIVGYFHHNMLCDLPDYSSLLIYQPLIKHSIIPYNYDQKEYKENDMLNLENFLRGIARHNKILFDYFNNLK